MSEELYFNDELRKCLNAAGLSDCGENDAWNYWYQRVYKAHNQTIDRVTEVQRAENAKLRDENAKLRKLVRDMDECLEHSKPFCKKCKFQELDCQWFEFDNRMRELGIEVPA